MTKRRTLSTLHMNPELTYSENLVQTINAHWNYSVARPEGFWDVVSNTRYGVPTIAQNSPHYKHRDIIRVKWYGRNLHITRR